MACRSRTSWRARRPQRSSHPWCRRSGRWTGAGSLVVSAGEARPCARAVGQRRWEAYGPCAAWSCSFQKAPEELHGCKGRQQLTVVGAILTLCGRELSWEEGDRLPGAAPALHRCPYSRSRTPPWAERLARGMCWWLHPWGLACRLGRLLLLLAAIEWRSASFFPFRPTAGWAGLVYELLWGCYACSDSPCRGIGVVICCP